MIVSHNRDFLTNSSPRPSNSARRAAPSFPRKHRLLPGQKSRGKRERGRLAHAKKLPRHHGQCRSEKISSQQPAVIHPRHQPQGAAQARSPGTRGEDKDPRPLEKELASLEEKIAEQEAAQATLTTALSSPEISEDSDKLRQTTNAVEKITKTPDLPTRAGHPSPRRSRR